MRRLRRRTGHRPICFRTIDRLGAGGAGEVYKLEDLKLGRAVAGKVVSGDRALRAGLADFLREARSLALFDDPRIVTVYEFRDQSDPPVLLMEFVDGFELGAGASSSSDGRGQRPGRRPTGSARNSRARSPRNRSGRSGNGRSSGRSHSPATR